MTKEEIIAQLNGLKDFCEELVDTLDPKDTWHEDILALRYAIAVLKKEPIAPQQTGSNKNTLQTNYIKEERSCK